MDDKTYNGWSNYETWAMALWIDNDEGSYHAARELVREAIDDIEESHVVEAADALKNWQEEVMYDWEPDAALVFTDLLHAAFSEVDWYEVAQHYVDEMAEVDA